MQAVRIPGLLLVVEECEWLPDEAADPLLGTHPHHSFRIFKDCFDRVTMQAVRIGRLFAVPNDLIALRVELEQAAIACAQPEHPIAVFIDGSHGSDALTTRLFRVKGVVRKFTALHVQGAQPS